MPPQQRWRRGGAAAATFGGAARTSSTTAKCADNQALVDTIVKKRKEPRAADTNYGFTLARAMRSLVDCREPVTTYQAVLQLKNVGPHVASLLFPNCPTKTTKKPTKKSKDSTTTAASQKKKASQKQTTASATTTATAGTKRKQPPAADVDDNPEEQERAAPSISTKQLRYQEAKARAEQQHLQRLAYLQQQQQQSGGQERDARAETCCLVCGKPLPDSCYHADSSWKVLLLIDGRERKSTEMVSKCLQAGIPCEERHLPIGDMTWIAEQQEQSQEQQACTCKSSTTTTTTQNKRKKAVPPPPPTEVLLGTIIERKTQDDWLSSMFGSRRYNEQRLRLKEAGQPQILFVLEGGGGTSTSTSSVRQRYKETLSTAVMATRLHYGFSIVRTKHLEDTVTTLQRLHRRILQRTFPQAFGSSRRLGINGDSASSTLQNSHQALYMSQDSCSSEPQQLPFFVPAMAASDVVRRQQKRKANGNGTSLQQKRRRKQSLQEMTFDTLPVPPLGMKRFTTYEELKAKIELSRELAQRSCGHIHSAMLKQVATFSQAKVSSITQVYPTMSHLLQAYTKAAATRKGGDETDDENNVSKRLVADVPIVSSFSTTTMEGHDEEAVGRIKKIGPRSSEELHIAYGVLDQDGLAAFGLPQGSSDDKDSGDDDDDENRKPAAKPTPAKGRGTTSSASVLQQLQEQPHYEPGRASVDDSVMLLEHDNMSDQDRGAATTAAATTASMAETATTTTARARTRSEEDAWLWESSRDDDSPLASSGSPKKRPPPSVNTKAAPSISTIRLDSSTDEDDDDEEVPPARATSATTGVASKNGNCRSQKRDIIEIDL